MVIAEAPQTVWTFREAYLSDLVENSQGQPKKKRGYMVRGKFEDILRSKAGQVSRDP